MYIYGSIIDSLYIHCLIAAQIKTIAMSLILVEWSMWQEGLHDEAEHEQGTKLSSLWDVEYFTRVCVMQL